LTELLRRLQSPAVLGGWTLGDGPAVDDEFIDTDDEEEAGRSSTVRSRSSHSFTICRGFIRALADPDRSSMDSTMASPSRCIRIRLIIILYRRQLDSDQYYARWIVTRLGGPESERFVGDVKTLRRYRTNLRHVRPDVQGLANRWKCSLARIDFQWSASVRFAFGDPASDRSDSVMSDYRRLRR
jgi:hypothetical protein